MFLFFHFEWRIDNLDIACGDWIFNYQVSVHNDMDQL